MKIFNHLNSLEFCLTGELKEAWELWQKQKEEKGGTGSLNVTGVSNFNSFEYSLIQLRGLRQEINEICEREFKISKTLLDYIDKIKEDY